MLLAVDTGLDERRGRSTAKALVLEAMRIAHAERRDCHVLAFGGADEVLQHTLCLTSSGWRRRWRFWHGLSRWHRCLWSARGSGRTGANGRWQNADLLIASDGAFGATPAVVAQLNAAKREQGLFVQGVLIGDRETIGLFEVADAVKNTGFATGAAGAAPQRWLATFPADFSPVHNKSLTALYFPRTAPHANMTYAVDLITLCRDVAATCAPPPIRALHLPPLRHSPCDGDNRGELLRWSLRTAAWALPSVLYEDALRDARTQQASVVGASVLAMIERYGARDAGARVLALAAANALARHVLTPWAGNRRSRQTRSAASSPPPVSTSAWWDFSPLLSASPPSAPD